MRQNLNDNFALTPARSGVPPVKTQIRQGLEKLQRVKEGVQVASLPEARKVAAKTKPAGIQMIRAHLQEVAHKMHQEGHTYRQWLQAGKKTLELLARERELEVLEIVHMLGWTWSPRIIARVYRLDPEVSSALPGILAKLTLAEILALFVAFGSEDFAAGPVRLFELLLGGETDINAFLTFKAVCNNHYPALKEMMRLCSRSERKGDIDQAIRTREDALNQWVFSTLVHISGIFEEGKRTPAGFFFPSVLATLLNLEVPDLMTCVGETLLPIFGAVMVYRYPDFPVALAARAGRVNLLTAIQGSEEVNLTQRFQCQIPVMAYCTLKSPEQTEYNYHQMIGARADRSRTLGKEVGTVEWSHGPSDPKTGKALYIPWKPQEMVALIQEYEDRVQQNVRRGGKFTHYKLTAPTDLSQQTLRTMRPKHGMMENLVDSCKFGHPVVGQELSFQYWLQHRQSHTIFLVLNNRFVKVAFPKVDSLVIPDSTLTLPWLAAISRRPDSIIKLPATMLSLLEGYGHEKLGEWVQRALDRKATTSTAPKPTEEITENQETVTKKPEDEPPLPRTDTVVLEKGPVETVNVEERLEEAMSVEGAETPVEVATSSCEPPVAMELTLPELDDEPTPPELIPPTPPEPNEDIPQESDSRRAVPSSTLDLIALNAAMDANQEAEDVVMDNPEN